eukprot:symbB.v1.2.021099.t1/scaffold1717.1/size104954/2
MAALDALVQERMRQDKDDRCVKQANRIRLIADPSMSVQGLQVCVKNFLSHKQTQDLWLCISPPPGTPSTYGWHSPPHGEWLTKASGLLYELLAVAENSKIHSTKLCKALKVLYDQKDLQVPLNHGHKQGSLQDEFDKYDFTIRVLMAMLRKLRASAQIKANVFRSLCKKDQTVLEILLAKVQLPQEFILDEYVRGEEDGLISQVDTHPAPADLAMVVSEPINVKKGKCGKDCGLPALPEIFGKITGKILQEPKALKKGSRSIQDVLDLALGHIPKQSKKPPPKAKAKAKSKGSTKAQPKNAAAKAKQAKEKKVAVEKPAQEHQYQAGDYAASREKYIQDLMEKNQCSWKTASQSWNGSMERATLLQFMSVGELKRRRFISKEVQENPFLNIVQKAKWAKKAKDVD